MDDKEKKLQDLLQKIRDKYEKDGEDPATYLEGLYYQKYITYWDYIQTDLLLNLQKPVTNIPDEMVFIVYHQTTELYFKLTLWEYQQIRDKGQPETSFFLNRLKRIQNYFQHLSHSFSIMTYGMEPEQFLKFRLALTPASGFQSAQFRYIELAMTPLINLVAADKRDALRNKSEEEQYEHIYWKHGATEVNTGKKAMVLRQFEEKYDKELLAAAKQWKGQTIYDQFLAMPDKDQKDTNLIKGMQSLDKTINVNWPKVHYKTAAHYLEAGGKPKDATGGTNWKNYLPPKFQKISFFPGLWTSTELENWGKD